jgi:mannose-1-phosphate guanylyltransferase
MKPSEDQMPKAQKRRWAVILAGGSGTRLQSLTRRLFGEGIRGEGRPKQFCTLFGGNTLLGHTQARIASVVSPQRTAYVVVKAHAPYYNAELADVPPERILAQPVDRGTTAAIAYALARVAAMHSQAMHSQNDEVDPIVGFFPADHYFADEDAFIRALDRAYRLAALHRDALLLLGAQPEHPEVEYGWIEPGAQIGRMDGGRAEGAQGGVHSIFRVSRFWEKPSAELASGLLDRGCLWNTFVMIGRVRTFLEALQESVPAVFRAFEPLLEKSPNPAAELAGQTDDLVGEAYTGLPSGDFSKQVLSALPNRLAVLRLDNVGWSDLGTPERLMETWSRFGVKPLTAA